MDLAQVIDQLSPANRQIAEQLIAQLAQRDGIDVNRTEMPEPIDSLPLWVAWLKSEGRSPRTIELYENDARHYLACDPHPTPLSIQAYTAKRLAGGTSEARVNSEQKALKSLFGHLHANGLWGTNPCASIKLVRGTSKEVDAPTNEEIMALINYKLHRQKDEPKFKLMLMLLLNTGLRMLEARSLRRQNISLTRGEVKVLGKGNKERTVPVSPFVCGLLKIYMSQYDHGSQYLFPASTKTGYWGHSGFWGAVKLACRHTGIRQLHPHQFRHFFATRTLEHGAKLEVISKLLGHSSIGITADIYRHISLGEYHREHEKHDPLEQLPITKMLTKGGDK